MPGAEREMRCGVGAVQQGGGAARGIGSQDNDCGGNVGMTRGGAGGNGIAGVCGGR